MDTTSNPDFAAVSAVCSLLSSLTVPYWIIGGWAIDLAVGRVTRDHADVDVMLLERDKHALWSDLTEVDVEPARALGPGRLVLHSDKLPLPTEVFLSRTDGMSLIYRRGAYSVTRALTDVTRYRDGIPYLAPEVVLLFKARSKAARDQHDVETALPLLDAGQRSWLHDTLKLLPQGKAAAVPRG
jgi:Aminoglycoside-2''-adenylyltransferase